VKLDEIAKSVSAKMIAKEIKKRFGYDVELINGHGYFYFIEPDELHRLDSWETTSVMVNSLRQLDLEQWMNEFKSLMDDNT
jgi:hypothetical protein